jgi:paraquat-inducible protein B
MMMGDPATKSGGLSEEYKKANTQEELGQVANLDSLMKSKENMDSIFSTFKGNSEMGTEKLFSAGDELNKNANKVAKQNIENSIRGLKDKVSNAELTLSKLESLEHSASPEDKSKYAAEISSLKAEVSHYSYELSSQETRARLYDSADD